jgi:hypothetical protein
MCLLVYDKPHFAVGKTVFVYPFKKKLGRGAVDLKGNEEVFLYLSVLRYPLRLEDDEVCPVFLQRQ